MAGDFDIRSAAREIVSTGDLVHTDTLTPGNGALDAGDSNVLINGNMAAGAVVRGSQSLLVEGSLAGEASQPCRVEMDGDVVVVGSVNHAQITGRSIRIGAGAHHCRLTAQGDIEVGANLANARIVTGAFDVQKREIRKFRQNIVQAKEEQAFIERQLRIDEKRMDKLFTTTRIVLDFSIEQIILRKLRRVQINLSPFYKIVKNKTEDEIDRALLEFFAKAVVGLLTRTNRDYVSSNQNRRKIFMGVIRSLHDLFALTRKLDRHTCQIARDEAELGGLIDALNDRTSAVYVRGTGRSDIDLQFVLPDVKRLEDRDIFFGTHTARLSIRPGADVDQQKVVRVDTDGEDSVVSLAPEALQGLSFRLHEGQIVWERIETPVRADAI